MEATIRKLNKLKQTKAAIKQAIVNKGVDVLDSEAFSTYPEKINRIFSTEDNEKNMLLREFPANTKLRIPDNVTTIGDYAFQNCYDNIVDIDLNNVTTIGNYSFENMRELKKITGNKVIKLGKSSFNGPAMSIVTPKVLTEINLPLYEITTESEYAFNGCDALKTLVIKNIGNVIPENCFYDCSKLDISKLDLTNVTEVKSGAFQIWNTKDLAKVPYEINLPNIEIIEGDAFRNRSKLTSINCGNNLKSIYNWAFSGCSLLNNINLGNSIELISYYAFENCTSLETINLGSVITEIGNWAFNGCTALKTITIDKPRDSIAGAPWGAPNAQVIWNG